MNSPARRVPPSTRSSSKDVNDTTQWKWTAGSNPDKDDLLHAYSAVYEVPGQKAGVEDQVLFFGADRFANNGDSNIGMWFLKDGTIDCNATTGGNQTFTGAHQDGDLLVVSSFTNGGGTATVQAFRSFGRIRRTRNNLEYPDTDTPDPTGDDVADAITTGRNARNAAATILDQDVLTPWR